MVRRKNQFVHRNYNIFIEYTTTDLSGQQIADKYGISQQRVVQIVQREESKRKEVRSERTAAQSAIPSIPPKKTIKNPSKK